jgi:hypothetical protein
VWPCSLNVRGIELGESLYAVLESTSLASCPWTVPTASRHRNTPFIGRLFVCLFGLSLGATRR